MKELLKLYKNSVLGFVEYRTPALHHATCTVLNPLDNLQENFLRNAGVAELEVDDVQPGTSGSKKGHSDAGTPA